MKALPSAQEIREMVEESEIDFKGFDFDVVSKYLGEYLTPDEIIKEGMEDIVYIKKEKAKRKTSTSRKKKKSVKNVNKKLSKKADKKTMNIKHGKKKVNHEKKKLDNIKHNDGNVTMVSDEGYLETTHKNEVRNHDNI